MQYARTVRAQTMVERGKEYVQAARLIKVPARRIMLSHILPNTLTPVLVAATLNFGMAILTEATLSFLGIGMPPTQPSLGTLIRIGNQYLFSGYWWIVLFPSLQLCLLVVVGQPARRLAARRAQSETEVESMSNLLIRNVRPDGAARPAIS